MDRNLVRARAKKFYKEMVKGTAKNKRASFAQMWPLIQANMKEESGRKSAVVDQPLTIEDAALLDGMMMEAEGASAQEIHQHGPDCSHGVEVIEAEVMVENTVGV